MGDFFQIFITPDDLIVIEAHENVVSRFIGEVGRFIIINSAQILQHIIDVVSSYGIVPVASEKFSQFIILGFTAGIDLGVHDFIVLSDGTRICNPKIYRKYEQKLQREQKKLSRMFNANVSHYIERNGKKYPVLKRPLKECRNYQKQKKVIAKIHEKIRNARRNFEHKVSTELIKNQDVICMEDLDIRGMLAEKKMAKEIADVSWSEFIRMLEYKAEWHGRKIIKTDRYFPSSQKCHACGHIQKENKDLHIRRWECPVCHSRHDRDINAAINIREKGIQILHA